MRWLMSMRMQIEKNDRNSTALSQYQSQIETAALVSRLFSFNVLLLFFSFSLSKLFYCLFSFSLLKWHVLAILPLNSSAKCTWDDRRNEYKFGCLHVVRYAQAKTS